MSEEIKEELSESGTGIGIEADSDNLIVEPFDPKAISIVPQVIPIEGLIRRMKQNTIRLNPGFQRNEVWTQQQRSRLIESILLKIPLPMFYVAADDEGRWEVVDGLQRLSTIRNFILGDAKGEKLRLEGLEFLSNRLNGFTFEQMEQDISLQQLVNTILEAEMRFTVINPGTPEAVKRNIFKRINTGGMPLTAQEIRHALYQGQVTDLLIDLVDSPEFCRAIGGNINDSRMGARELIMYFLAFLILPRDRYRGSVDDWLSKAMQVINAMPGLDNKELLRIFPDGNIPEIRYTTISSIKKQFALAMERGYELFERHAFRKSLPDSRRTPINKALFETWSNILCEMNEEDYEFLYENWEELYDRYEVLLRGSSKFEYHYLSLISLGASEDLITFLETLQKNDTLNRTHLDAAWQIGTDDELRDDLLEKILDLLHGHALDDAISRNSSEVESAMRRYRLIGNLINSILKERE